MGQDLHGLFENVPTFLGRYGECCNVVKLQKWLPSQETIYMGLSGSSVFLEDASPSLGIIILVAKWRLSHWKKSRIYKSENVPSHLIWMRYAYAMENPSLPLAFTGFLCHLSACVRVQHFPHRILGTFSQIPSLYFLFLLPPRFKILSPCMHFALPASYVVWAKLSLFLQKSLLHNKCLISSLYLTVPPQRTVC